MKTLEITRIDYQNPIETGRFYSLPKLNNLNQITDVNEVHQINITFDTHEDAIELASKFPNSYKVKVDKMWGHDKDYKSYCTFFISFKFNTFFHNGVTGAVNETAIKKREKVIAKLKTLI